MNSFQQLDRRSLGPIVCTLLVLAAGSSSSSAQSLPTLDELRAIHAAREAAPGIVRVTETVARAETRNPAVVARQQQQHAERLELALETARRQHAEEGSTDAGDLRNQEQQIRRTFDHIGAVAMLRLTLNSGVAARRTRLVDLAGGRVRWDDVDPRDLDQLSRDHQLTAIQRSNLDLSRISIAKNGSHWTAAVADRLATRSTMGLQNLDAERIRLGIVPHAVLDPLRAPTLSWPSGPDIAVISANAGESVLRLTLDRSQGWSVVRYEMNHSQSSRHVWNVDGFITQNDIRIPARITHSVRKDGVDDYMTESVDTIGVETGVQATEASFDLPAEYRVQEPPAPCGNS